MIIIIHVLYVYIYLLAQCLLFQRSTTDTADESDFTPHGIVLEITLVKGQRVVTVRSPLQVHTICLRKRIKFKKEK